MAPSHASASCGRVESRQVVEATAGYGKTRATASPSSTTQLKEVTGTAKDRMDVLEMLGKEAPEADLNFLRVGLQVLIQAVMVALGHAGGHTGVAGPEGAGGHCHFLDRKGLGPKAQSEPGGSRRRP